MEHPADEVNVHIDQPRQQELPRAVVPHGAARGPGFRRVGANGGDFPVFDQYVHVRLRGRASAVDHGGVGDQQRTVGGHQRSRR